MREYGCDIRLIYLESQSLAKKQSSFKVFFITQLSRLHYLATIAFILDQCFSNFFIPSPPFHCRHVIFAPQA